MINFEQLMEATERPEVSELKTGAFSEKDIANLILQRSEIIRDQHRPGSAVKAWMNGDSSPLNAIVDKLGTELIHRAASIIFLEYHEISKAIEDVAPAKIADIGCGYAFIDYFLYRDTQAHLYLIDLEETEDRHFGFSNSGAAYSSLNVARTFLQDNGVPEESVTCINPTQQEVLKLPKIDLTMSFISCGFHYPLSTYDTFFKDRIQKGGAIIVDIRNRKLKNERPVLESYGETTELTKSANGNATRFISRILL